MSTSHRSHIDLSGLTLASSQVWGGVRLVPLLRSEPRVDLRLVGQRYDDSGAIVTLRGELREPSLAYFSYVPHGLVLHWGDRAQQASLGTQLAKRKHHKRLKGSKLPLHHRMAKRQDPTSLRILPLHLAMEGYLALHFNGPECMWSEYSRQAISHGLSPRVEYTHDGDEVLGLEGALRTFEIHPSQCGVLVFVADAFATAFVAPHPRDYAALHRTLINDMFCELLVRYSEWHPDVQETSVELSSDGVETLADIEAQLDRAAEEWSAYEASLAAGLLGQSVQAERVYQAGTFRLERFRTEMALHDENYIGERITAADGSLQYLKVMRLSDMQTKRAYLLMQLAAHDWNIQATATSLGDTREGLVRRIFSAGFGYLLKPHVLAASLR